MPSWARPHLRSSSRIPRQAAKDEYRCDCCRTPCKKCDGAYDFGGDLASAAAITEVVTARMAELTDPDKAKELFSPASANGQTFSTEKFWSEAPEAHGRLSSA